MDYEYLALGDRALLLQFGVRVDAGVSAQVHAAARALARVHLPGVTAIVPSYAALAIELDLSVLERQGGEIALRARIDECLSGNRIAVERLDSAPIVDIPTRYGGDDGPDLRGVSERLDCSESDVIRMHTAPLYRVAQVGFQPGFPYLLGLDVRLHLPRLDTPRPRVAAGSVAIGGAQTGIYPQASPGGWHLLGRTDLRLFNPQSTPPALLAPGARVRFVAIDSCA